MPAGKKALRRPRTENAKTNACPREPQEHYLFFQATTQWLRGLCSLKPRVFVRNLSPRGSWGGTPPGTIIGLSGDHKDRAKCRRDCRDRHRKLHAQTKKRSYGNDIRGKLGPGTTPSLPNYMYAELCRIATIDTKHDMTHVFHLVMPEISFNSKSNSKYKDIPAQETEPRCFGELCFWPSPQLRGRTCQTLENTPNQLED